MKKIIWIKMIVLLLVCQQICFAQTPGVLVSNVNGVPDASAIFELSSTAQGFLPPRMNATQRMNISNPAEGLIVYDTDMDQFYYYNDSSWITVGTSTGGLWSAYGPDISYNTGKVGIGTTAPLSHLHIYGEGNESGLLSQIEADSALNLFFGIANVVGTQATNMSGEGIMGLKVGTTLSGISNLGAMGILSEVVNIAIEEDTMVVPVVGIGSIVESNGLMTGGIMSQVIYNGFGADSINQQLLFPMVVGTFQEIIVQKDSMDLPVMAKVVGTFTNVTSDQLGYNVGALIQSASDSTYANIGIWSQVNGGEADEDMQDTFPNRFTAGIRSFNGDDSETDFNIFISGSAKSYFEGNVGIGTLSPVAKLDISGAVNASAYLINGDTLALGSQWLGNDNDIYYNGGNVQVGRRLPDVNANFSVIGDLLLISDTVPSFPECFFVAAKDSMWLIRPGETLNWEKPLIGMGMRDTIWRGGHYDTIAVNFIMNSLEDGISSSWAYHSDSVFNIIRLTSAYEADSGGIDLVSQSSPVESMYSDSLYYVKSSIHLDQDGEINMRTGTQFRYSEYFSDSSHIRMKVKGENTLIVAINDTGVGIGTSNPSYELEVCGEIATTAVSVTTEISCSSDERLKKNIQPIDHALEKVLATQGVTYEWRIDEFPEKGFNEGTQIGVIAQELEKIYPELVKTQKDGFKSVDYVKLTPILIEAIKSLSAHIEQLESKNENLQRGMDALHLRVEAIEKGIVIRQAEAAESSSK